MSRTMFSQARTGRRASTGGFTSVDELKWEVGKSNRVVIPIKEDKDGNKGVVIFGQTIHRVEAGVLQLPRRNGGTYTTREFRCSHPYSQMNRKDSVNIAKKEEMCVLCEYEKLQSSQRFGILEQEFGTEEEEYKDWGENFKALTKAEKKQFFTDNPISVEKSYYSKEDEDGNKFNVNTTIMYLLMYDIEVEEVKVKKKTKAGKVVTVSEVRPVMDKDDKVKYKPVLFKVSEKRLGMLKDAVDNALASETISYDNLHTFIENEGTEFEEEVHVGWIDFELKYPKKDGDTARMESARDMTILASTDAKSILLQNEGLIDEMKARVNSDYASAKGSFENVYKNLQLYTREEQLAMLSPEDRGLFEQLREEYRTDEDEEFEQGVYATVLETETGDTGEGEESEAVEEEKPKKAAKTTAKKTTKKPTKKVEDVEEEPEDDLELDDDDLFED